MILFWRRFLQFFYLGSLFYLLSCNEAKVYEKSLTINPENAGHYILEVAGESNRLTSVRLLLTPDGKAEQHALERGNRWSDYQLEEIRRGRWYNLDSSLMVILESNSGWSKARDSVSQTYTLHLRPSPRDSTILDTLWTAQEENGKFLRLISRF